MSNAGYGNHDAPPPAPAGQAAASGRPAVALTDSAGRPLPMDRTVPAPEAVAGNTEAGSATPGAGALSDSGNGGDVDPGAG